MAQSILIIEKDNAVTESLKELFTGEDYFVETSDSAENGLDLVSMRFFDIVIAGVSFPGMDCVEFLAKAKEEYPDQIFIILTPPESIDIAKRALKAGAYHFLVKPVSKSEILRLVRNAIRQRSLLIQNLLLKREIGKDFDFSSIKGESAGLKAIISQVKKVADSRSNVLLLGETGTGKELFSRVIHNNSSRREMPFIPINCSAIPETLIESELFGHLKGAFTGAIGSKKGLFAEADGGTVFLDEIGDLSASFQVKLLRVLEDHMIRPVGSNSASKVDLRFIAATNRNLKADAEQGRFREDLYYRIQAITLHIPPLRDRKEDIPLLAQNCLGKYAEELQKPVRGITDKAMAVMCNYNWPGNIRELQNVIERAVLITDHEKIDVSDLPEGLGVFEHSEGSFAAEDFVSSAMDKCLTIDNYAKEFVLKFEGMYTEQQIADMLGISRKSLWEKRKRWGMVRGNRATGGPASPNQ